MEALSSLDESFLHLETHYSQMHIGSVAIFEGPPPPYHELVAMVEAKLGLVPRYRQKIRFVPLGHRPAALGRRPALQLRLPPAPHCAAVPAARSSCATSSAA